MLTVLAITKSALEFLALIVALPVVPSGFSLDFTSTTFVISPSLFTLTLMVKVLVSFTLSESNDHTPVCGSYLPPLLSDIYVTPSGNLSFAVIPVALDGPLFVTVIVYSITSPTLGSVSFAVTSTSNSVTGFTFNVNSS